MKFSTKGKIASLLSLAVLMASVLLGSNLAYAASAGLSVSSTSVRVNEEFTVSIGITDAASWDVHVVATGPAENCVIDRTGATEPGETDPGTVLETVATSSPTFSVTCAATEAGEVSLALSGTITDGEGASTEISGSVSVPASNPTPPEPEPEPEPEPSPTPPEPEPAPTPVDDGDEGEDEPEEESSRPGVQPVAPIISTTDPETPSDPADPETPEGAEDPEPSKPAVETKDDDKEAALAISGSSDDHVKKTLVIVLAVVATLIGLVEAFLILSSRRKERLQTLREKAQALQVVTATMQLAQALDKKA